MLKTKEFYGLWLCYTIGTFSGLIAIGITSPFAQEVIGIKSDHAALFVSVFAFFNGIGRPLFGYLADKISVSKTVILSFILIIIASLMGLFLKEKSIILFFVVFSSLWMMLGGWLAIAPVITSRNFGLKNYSSNYGIVFTAYGTGAILSMLLSGSIKDFPGSYVYVFYPTIALSFLGIIISYLTLKEKVNVG